MNEYVIYCNSNAKKKKIYCCMICNICTFVIENAPDFNDTLDNKSCYQSV